MPNEYAFSGPGDIDRGADPADDKSVPSTPTTDGSRAANAAADDTEDTIQWTLRDGYADTIDFEAEQNYHAYGNQTVEAEDEPAGGNP